MRRQKGNVYNARTLCVIISLLVKFIGTLHCYADFIPWQSGRLFKMQIPDGYEKSNSTLSLLSIVQTSAVD